MNLNPDVVFYFILPALIYPAALFTSWRDFQRNLRPILLLAIGLVLATTLAVAWIAHSIVPALPWAAAFALGRNDLAGMRPDQHTRNSQSHSH